MFKLIEVVVLFNFSLPIEAYAQKVHMAYSMRIFCEIKIVRRFQGLEDGNQRSPKRQLSIYKTNWSIKLYLFLHPIYY